MKVDKIDVNRDFNLEDFSCDVNFVTQMKVKTHPTP